MVLSCSPDSYIVTDANGQIQEANQAAIALLNLSRAFLIGKPLVIFVDELERNAFRSKLLQLRQEYWPQELEVRLQPRQSGGEWGRLDDLYGAIAQSPQGESLIAAHASLR